MSFIVYEGPSRLADKSDIIGILLLKSHNVKTGNMAQLYILRKDMSPLDAYHQAKDDAICGDCVHRRSTGGGCYVNIGQGPENVYKAYLRGKYKPIAVKDLAKYNMNLRFGAYGDPLALPLRLITQLKDVCVDYTGYTHQMKTIKSDRRHRYSWMMESSDSVEQTERAYKDGRNTFRVGSISSKLEFERVCPNYTMEAMGKTNPIQCEKCLLCGSKQNKPVLIPAHGILKRKVNNVVN